MPGDRSQKRSATIGAAIILGIVVFASGLFFIQDILRVFRPAFHLVALMGDAGALQSGSPVWIAGRPVGTVKTVVIRGVDVDSAERVAVTLQIPRKYQTHVRRDSQVRMTSSSLIGNPVIDISPGSPGAKMIADGDTLRSTGPGSVEALMDHTLAVSNGLRGLFADLNTLKSSSPNAPAEFARVNSNLQHVTLQFHQLMTNMQNGPINRLHEPAFRNAVADLRAMSGQLSSQLSAASERARRARSSSEPALRLMAARADTIQAQMALVQQRIAEGGGGLLLRAQKDSAIMRAVHGAQEQLDSLMAVTKRNPLRFWF